MVREVALQSSKTAIMLGPISEFCLGILHVCLMILSPKHEMQSPFPSRPNKRGSKAKKRECPDFKKKKLYSNLETSLNQSRFFFSFFFSLYLMGKNAKTSKIMILTSEWSAKQPFSGWNTQQLTFLFVWVFQTLYAISHSRDPGSV